MVTATQATRTSDYDNKSPNITIPVVTSFPTDVRFFDGDYGTLNNARAWGTCEQGSQKGGTGVFSWCTSQLVFYNNGRYPNDYNSTAERDHMACHELGHTLGLRHTTLPSCMFNPSADFTQGTNTTLHDIDCIFQAYVNGVRCP